MDADAQEIYNRLKLRPRRVKQPGSTSEATKTTAKNTAKTPPKSEA